MAEVKLIFGDVQVNQSLALTVEKDNEDFIFSETFKQSRTQKGEVEIGLSPNETARNYADGLKLDFSFFSNGDITITVSRNVVILTYDINFIDIKSVTGSTITNQTVIESSTVFSLKYWFEFTDVQRVLHRVEILKSSFTDLPVQIYGTCSLEYAETKDTLEPIRGCGLKIDLEANSDLSFSDLYSEEERTFSVVYKRDNEILFNGWLSPEGVFESLVSDKWVISLDCTDGIGFLKNLSYVDSNGFTFNGKQSILEIVSNCLKRTKTLQDIYVNIDIIYSGMNFYDDVLNKTYLNADRFVKDDSKTIADCDKVLRSVLDLFGAVLVSYRGKWVIFKPNTLALKQNIYFFNYDYNGVNLGTKDPINFAENLGSQIDGFYPHHVNGNQQKTITNSIGAFRIDYKFGGIENFFQNLDLEGSLNGGVYTVSEWTITDYQSFDIPQNNRGLRFEDNGLLQRVAFSESYGVNNGDSFTFFTSFFFNDIIVEYIQLGFTYFVRANFKIILEGDNESYYLRDDGSWQNNDNLITLEYIANSFLKNGEENVFNFEVKTDTAPIEGEIRIELYKPSQPSPVRLEFFINYTACNLAPNINDNLSEGLTYQFERIINPSSKIAENKEIFNADSVSEGLLGTIFKQNKISQTEVWRRLNEIDFNKTIVQIMGEERMKMYSRPRVVFSGDVFGFFNYLSVFTINNIEGLFMATRYNYDAVNNITSLELTEIIDTNILNDIDFKTLPQYKEVVEPTIKG
jgi:hypothetical protein